MRACVCVAGAGCFQFISVYPNKLLFVGTKSGGQNIRRHSIRCVHLREWLNGIYKRDSSVILHLLLTDSEYIKMCATAEYPSGADLTVPLKLELPSTLFLSLFPISICIPLSTLFHPLLLALFFQHHLDNSLCVHVRVEYFSETQMFLYDLIIDVVQQNVSVFSTVYMCFSCICYFI